MTETALKTLATEISIILRKDELGLTRITLPKADMCQDDYIEALLRVQSEIADELEGFDLDAWRSRKLGLSVELIKFMRDCPDMPLKDTPEVYQAELVGMIDRCRA